jgi:serine-aspartate repeat-containing protein C/D/E
VGLWSLLTGWRKKTNQRSPQRRSRQTRAERGRRCQFERMEERRLLAADLIRIGVVYIEEDSGSDVHPDTFEIMFEGGAPGTELTRLVIDGDKGIPGLSLGDMIFDTIKGGIGADKAHPLKIVSSTGIDHVSWKVEDGSSLLIFEFRGFHAGEKLVFTIDVDEIQDLEPQDEGLNPKDWPSWPAARLNHINEGIDPIASGVEFQGSKLHAEFKAPHYHDVSGTSQFRNAYDPLFVGSNLLISQGNNSGLPHDDHLGKRDRTAGTLLSLQQIPKPVTIGGRVFADNNRNLVQDGNDFGIGGVALALWQNVNGTWTFTGHTTTTNAQGDYEFGLNLNLQPGTYQVRQTQPAGYFSVGAIPGNVSGTPTGQTVAGNPDILTNIQIPLGDLHGVHYNFAEAQPASLRGRVHLTDADGNCFSEEALNRPLAGVKITLKDEMGNVLAVTHTNAQGEYVFNNLMPGTYTIVEETPPG